MIILIKHSLSFKFSCFFFLAFGFQAKAQTLQWAKAIEGGNYSIGISIATDPSGNVYSTGVFEGTVDFDPGGGVYNLTSLGTGDIFIEKLDSSGNFLWAKSFGGPVGAGRSIAVDSFENIYVTGYFEDTADFDPGSGTKYLVSKGMQDIFFAKYDINGNYVWAKSVGSVGEDWGNSIVLMSSALYVVGQFHDTLDADPGAGAFNLVSSGMYDILVQKLDTAGNFSWAISEGGLGYDIGTSIALDTSGNLYITGLYAGTVDFNPGGGTFNLSSASGGYDNDAFVQKLDTLGNLVWVKSLGGAKQDGAEDIAVDNSGDIVITGEFTGIADFDPGAITFNLISSGSQDVFICKLDTAGNFVWAKSVGGNYFNVGRSLTVAASGSVYVTGSFQGTADFDPGSGTFNLTAANSDAFILKLTDEGSFGWAANIGGGGMGDQGRCIETDANDNVYATGYFKGTADFDPGTGVYNLTSLGASYDCFMLKLNTPLSVGVIEEENETGIQLYPNPGNGYFTILFSAKEMAIIDVYDVTGSLLEEISTQKEEEIKLDFSRRAKGIYYVKVTSAEESYVRKLILK